MSSFLWWSKIVEFYTLLTNRIFPRPVSLFCSASFLAQASLLSDKMIKKNFDYWHIKPEFETRFSPNVETKIKQIKKDNRMLPFATHHPSFGQGHLCCYTKLQHTPIYLSRTNFMKQVKTLKWNKLHTGTMNEKKLNEIKTMKNTNCGYKHRSDCP